jgi:hypothetical protein
MHYPFASDDPAALGSQRRPPLEETREQATRMNKTLAKTKVWNRTASLF